MLSTHRLRALIALFAACALVGFTGCGGDDDKKDSGDNGSQTTSDSGSSDSGGGDVAEYKEGAEKAANDFKNAAQAASEKTQSATTTEDKIAGLDALKDSVNQAADDFEALDPPANVKADNDELVAEFRQLASDVDAVKEALKTQDQAKAQAALTRLQSNQTKIGETIASIQSKIGS